MTHNPLEYVIGRLIGPPVNGSAAGDGSGYWPCPNCGSDKLRPYPHKPEYRDRYSCLVCGIRGDAHDFLKLMAERRPEHNGFADYGIRKMYLAQMATEHMEHLAQHGSSANSSGGTGGFLTDEEYRDYKATVWAALEPFDAAEREVLAKLYLVVRNQRLDPYDLIHAAATDRARERGWTEEEMRSVLNEMNERVA